MYSSLLVGIPDLLVSYSTILLYSLLISVVCSRIRLLYGTSRTSGLVLTPGYPVVLWLGGLYSVGCALCWVLSAEYTRCSCSW